MRRTIAGPPARPRCAAAMRLLDVDGAAHRVDRAAELDQHAVAHQLDDAPAVLGDSGSNSPCAALFSRASVPASSCSIRRE